MNKNFEALHSQPTKDWINKTTLKSNEQIRAHYKKSSQEIKAETMIDNMFDKLDADGGGTLDMGEITTLFQKNGIMMSM